nr:hypothetical protein [Tanacetum cinerariifolium]
MDSIIPLGQKNTLAKYMILFGADNRPPMLVKDLYDFWKSRMELYMQNREHGRMILEVAKDLWERVQLLMQGTSLTKKERENQAKEDKIRVLRVVDHIGTLIAQGGEGHIARQCSQPKRPRNTDWFKRKILLVQAHESRVVLDVEQLAFLADPGVAQGLKIHTTFPTNAAFHTNDLDSFNLDCDVHHQ